MPLVLTSSGIEECPLIDPGQLDALAKWLCDQQCYHDKQDAWMRRKLSDAEQAAFEREIEHNGGYCNGCRDFAGEILSHFDLTQSFDDGGDVLHGRKR